jgi:hypothetical protein
VGPSFFFLPKLGPNQKAEFDVSVFPTHVAGTVGFVAVVVTENNMWQVGMVCVLQAETL